MGLITETIAKQMAQVGEPKVTTQNTVTTEPTEPLNLANLAIMALLLMEDKAKAAQVPVSQAGTAGPYGANKYTQVQPIPQTTLGTTPTPSANMNPLQLMEMFKGLFGG